MGVQHLCMDIYRSQGNPTSYCSTISHWVQYNHSSCWLLFNLLIGYMFHNHSTMEGVSYENMWKSSRQLMLQCQVMAINHHDAKRLVTYLAHPKST